MRNIVTRINNIFIYFLLFFFDRVLSVKQSKLINDQLK